MGGGVNGTITIVRSTVSDNFAAGSGGGFDDENGFGTLVIQQSLFSGNSAVLDGGAIRGHHPHRLSTPSPARDWPKRSPVLRWSSMSRMRPRGRTTRSWRFSNQDFPDSLHDRACLITDPKALYYGITVNDQSLTPGDHPRLGPTRFKDWLGHNAESRAADRGGV
jgi:hypothetical protein